MDELRSALELATDDELQDLTEILFRRKFNPLDYLQGIDPIQVQSHDRNHWLTTLEHRFRYLAADGLTVLKGETQAVSYRQVLMRVCRYLKIPFKVTLSTTDLEAEIFLYLMQRTWKGVSKGDRQKVLEQIREAVHTTPNQPLPLSCSTDSLRLLLEGGSALAIGSVLRPIILRQIAQQLALHFAQSQMTRGLLSSAAGLQGRLALQAAQQGLSGSALRYGAARSMFAALGCALWVGFVLDLGWRSIATNYGRIIPMIFTLAQIRLTRTDYGYVCAV
jgi:uncharacterized protein YaaW (UPF0174 family)